MDCLRWYRDFETCEEVLFERYFRCNDLGKDLVPVVQEFKASTECATGVPTESSTVRDPPLQQDFDIVVPDPINLMDFIRSVEAELLDGMEIDVMSHLKHQDKEFQGACRAHIRSILAHIRMHVSKRVCICIRTRCITSTCATYILHKATYV